MVFTPKQLQEFMTVTISTISHKCNSEVLTKRQNKTNVNHIEYK